MTRFYLRLLLLISLLLASSSLRANDSTPPRKSVKIKKGWNFGALPTITYNTDLGLQYGALVNFFYYGDGTSYPVYLQSLYAEVSRYTKGSGINRIYWDTKTLIPKVRWITDLSYITDKTQDFFGFNGFQTTYHPSWIQTGDEAYISRMFYKYDRRFLRFTTDFRWKMGHPRIEYFAGASFNSYRVARVDFNNLNRGKSEAKILNDTTTLFDLYKNWGLIGEEESTGGNFTYIKIGACFDSRDHEASTTRGLLTEALLTFAPAFLGMKGYGHSLFGISHRQYIPFFKGRLVGLYRLAYQQKLSGDIPFFLAQNIPSLSQRRVSNEGLGGATTLRGVLRNRLQGDGMAYGNVELRWQFVNFRFINQNWHLTLNAFLDAGMVTDARELHPNNPAILQNPLYFSGKKERLHASYGAGLGIVMNRNFIIAVDYGRATRPEDGKSGFYMGINYVL